MWKRVAEPKLDRHFLPWRTPDSGVPVFRHRPEMLLGSEAERAAGLPPHGQELMGTLPPAGP